MVRRSKRGIIVSKQRLLLTSSCRRAAEIHRSIQPPFLSPSTEARIIIWEARVCPSLVRNATKSLAGDGDRLATGGPRRASGEREKEKASGKEGERKKRAATTTTAAGITRPDAHGIVPVLCTLAGEPLSRMARHFCYEQPIRPSN